MFRALVAFQATVIYTASWAGELPRTGAELAHGRHDVKT